MGTILATFGSAVFGAVTTFFSKKAVKTVVIIASIVALVTIVPFSLALPGEFVDYFEVGGTIHTIFVGLNYFVPVGYLLTCAILVFLIHYTKFFWRLMINLISWFIKE